MNSCPHCGHQAPRLTTMERAVLYWIVRRNCQKTICRILNRSIGTIKVHTRNIRLKLSVRSRAELIEVGSEYLKSRSRPPASAGETATAAIAETKRKS